MKNTTRIGIVLCISLAFFLAEITTGFRTKSLALIADAFHYLNDIVAYAIAFVAAHLHEKGKPNAKFTFAFLRAEFVGAFFNGVFLLALALSIFLQSIERFINLEEIKAPIQVLIIGSIGLCLNIVSILAVHEHGGHSHGHGGHSHGEHGERGYGTDAMEHELGGHSHGEHGHGTDAMERERGGHGHGPNALEHEHGGHSHGEHGEHEHGIDALEHEHSGPRHGGHSHGEHGHGHGTHLMEHEHGPVEHGHSTDTMELIHQGKLETAELRDRVHALHHHTVNQAAAAPQHNLNLLGVLIHLFGDAVNNVAVILSAIIIWKVQSPHRFYADPAVSLIISLIIFGSAVPMTLKSGRILLEATPSFLDLEKIKDDLLAVPNVLSVHDLHVWHLSQSIILASLHVCVPKGMALEEWEKTEQYLQDRFAAYGIGHVTISPEVQRDAKDSTELIAGCRLTGSHPFGCAITSVTKTQNGASV